MEDPFPGGRETIRQAFLRKGVPLEAIEITLASLSEATIKQYSKPLDKWWSFCQASTACPFSPDPRQVLSFLSQELNISGSYAFINTTRSAISLILNNEIGSHPRFCKGVGVLRPPKPRYEYIWDPAPVISKLASFYPHESLSLERVTRKLVLLLALATGQRTQTLAALKLSQISISDKISIRIPDRLKTSAPGRSQPFFSFSPFEGHENLCIYSLMKHYVHIIKDIRSPSQDSLFLSFVMPHKTVSSQTISRWIKLSLEECGVRSDLFTAHSTRHASTSRAAQKGVSLDLIKRAAGWSGQSRVFAVFYNRPMLDPEEFNRTILRPEM